MGKIFYLQLDMFLTVELLRLQSVKVLLEAISHCKQKNAIVSTLLTKKLPNTIVSKKLHCKQEASNCKQGGCIYKSLCL